MASTTYDAPPGAEGLPLWRRLLPFVVAALLVGWVMSRLDLAGFKGALARTHYAGYIAFAVAFMTLVLSADAFATAHVYRRSVGAVSFRELWLIRGGSYLPSLLNHHVGQAWLTWFVAKRYGTPLWRVAGATLLVYVTTFGCLFLLVVLALPYNAAQIPWLIPTVVVLSVAAIGYALVIARGPAFLRRWQATQPLVDAGIEGHARALALRIPHVLVQFLGAWLPFWFFGVNVPLKDALAYVPVIMLVQTLPVTPQGFGTRDVIALQLLSHYAPGTPEQQTATIAAATLSWGCLLTIIQALASPLLLRRAQRLLTEGPQAERKDGG
jgi:hypothetical protein